MTGFLSSKPVECPPLVYSFLFSELAKHVAFGLKTVVGEQAGFVLGADHDECHDKGRVSQMTIFKPENK